MTATRERNLTMLNKLGLKRYGRWQVGKQVGSKIYVHKKYATRMLMPDICDFKEHLPADFEYTIVRYDIKARNVAFIHSPDWDTANEPLVGDSYLVKYNDDNEVSIKLTKARQRNQQIYHHKHLFVKDNYTGFDINDSIERSVEWCEHRTKEITPKIGNSEFWDSWLEQKGLSPRLC